MDFFFFVFVGFVLFVLCSLCGFCCRKKDEGAVYSTPVVVTSETHHPPGSNYAVQQTTIPIIPQQNNSMPYPATGGMPFPQTQPIQPYPPGNVAAPYPTSMPYPNYPPQTMIEPPSYNEVVTQVPYPQGSVPYPQQGSAPYPTQSPFPQQAPYPQQNPYNPSYKEGM